MIKIFLIIIIYLIFKFININKYLIIIYLRDYLIALLTLISIYSSNS